MDLVDSLVRKSLVTTEQAGGRARYDMLETVRQFAEEQLATTAGVDRVRDDHAGFYNSRSSSTGSAGTGPISALRSTGSTWAGQPPGWLPLGDGDLRRRGAATIAAHTALVPFQGAEPSAWSEEILPAAISAAVPHLPRLYVAASYCGFTGRPLDAVEFAEAAVRLQDARL